MSVKKNYCCISNAFLLLCTGKWQKNNGLKHRSNTCLWTIAGLHDDPNLMISGYLPVWTPRDIKFVPETYIQRRWCKTTEYSPHTSNCWQQIKYWFEDGNPCEYLFLNRWWFELVGHLDKAILFCHLALKTSKLGLKSDKDCSCFPVSIRKPLVPVKHAPYSDRLISMYLCRFWIKRLEIWLIDIHLLQMWKNSSYLFKNILYVEKLNFEVKSA